MENRGRTGILGAWWHVSILKLYYIPAVRIPYKGHHFLQARCRGWLDIALTTDVFVMGKGGQAGMVRRIVPTDLQLVGGRQPVITIAYQHLSVPLFSEPEIGAILEV